MILFFDEAYLPDQRATAYQATVVDDKAVWSTTVYKLDRDMRKTKKKQLMIMAKALFLHQPKDSHFTLRQIYQKLKDVVKDRNAAGL